MQTEIAVNKGKPCALLEGGPSHDVPVDATENSSAEIALALNARVEEILASPEAVNDFGRHILTQAANAWDAWAGTMDQETRVLAVQEMLRPLGWLYRRRTTQAGDHSTLTGAA